MNKNLLKEEGRIISLKRLFCLFFIFSFFLSSNFIAFAAEDTKKPILKLLDNTEVGPVISDTVTPEVQELNPDFSSYKYAFTDSVKCSLAIYVNDYVNDYITNVPIVFNTDEHNGEYICFQAIDLSGNINYIATANPLNISDIDVTVPVITLVGSSFINNEALVAYVDEGATYYDDFDGTGTINGVGFVDVNTLGTYTLTYDITDSSGNIALQAIRTVIVSDTIAPVLTILGVNPYFSEYGSAYSDLGAECNDIFDGLLIVEEYQEVDTLELGEYSTEFYCEDFSGNGAGYIREIIVVDTTPANITLIGSGALSHEKGTTYTDAGASFLDLVDGTGALVGSGVLDTNTVGTYVLTYNYTDSSGNISTEVIRTVNVVDTIAPDTPNVTSPSEAAIISTNIPTILGTGDSGDTITIVNGEYTYTGVVDVSGNWSIDIIDALAESNNTIHITANDPNLNISLINLLSFVVSTSVDTDSDGVPDLVEIEQGTSPTSSGSFLDTDSDGITDFIDANDDGDSLDDWVEIAAPNSGDANNDGVQDSTQGDVSSLMSEVTSDYVSLDTTSGTDSCNASVFEILSEESLVTQDGTNDYPVGLNNFTLNCSSSGATIDIKVYYDKSYDISSWVYKKYNISNDTYTDMSSIVTYSIENIGGVDVTVVSYSITDGGAYDEDGVANGVIVDPSGPAVDITPIVDPVCGEGLGSWLNDSNKIKLKKKRLKKRIKFKFLNKRYKRLFLNNDEIDENDNYDEYDDEYYEGENENEEDELLGGMTESEIIALISTKYQQCYDKDGLEKFIPKHFVKLIDRLLIRLSNVNSTDKVEGIIVISYARLEKMKNRNNNNPRLINLINYLQMKLSIAYFD